jgi:mannose-6-phosphate isomerase-like protein (cupin superfamily)
MFAASVAVSSRATDFERSTSRESALSNSPKPLRRVVTGHAADGRAIVLFDDNTPNTISRPDTGISAHWVWTTDQAPANIHVTTDASAPRKGLTPAPMGSIFRVVDFPPTPATGKGADEDFRKSLGLHDESGKRRPARHPQMHATETIDYAIVLEGKVDMMLDDEVVTLSAGDVVVQQATNHAWINHGPDMCRIAFVLIDSKPF